MSAGVLLAIAVAAIALLLFLVIKVRLSAFVSMILVAFLTALATKIAPQKIVSTLQGGMGNTLASVMIVVGLGAMLGRFIEVGGGADSLARTFTKKLGEKRVIAAVTAAAFVLGIPVFFDVGFIILAPIVFGFARVAKINPLKIGLPVAATMLTVHVALPPHPGPVAAAATTGADNGLILMLGLPLSALACALGYVVCKRFNVEAITLLDSPATVSADLVAAEYAEGTSGKKPVGAGLVILLILLPLLQIAAGTFGNMSLPKDSAAQRWLGMIGASPIALLVAVIVAYLLIGHQQKWSLDKRTQVMDSALPDVSTIVFVTGAGGVFAAVLVASGIGKALSNVLIATSMPIILVAFLISLALRASQGSATVAILTTAGLLSTAIADAHYSSVQTALVTLAIGFGGLGLSHINDSGFWIVTKYLGLSVKDGLKTWTVITTIFGLLGFLLTWGVFLLV